MKPENNLENSLDKLGKLGTDPDEFKIWLKSFLIKNISDPLPGFSRTEYPHDYLTRIYESTGSVRFQERLRHSVKELFKNWNINARITESIEYYSSLLNLIAELPISEMYPELIETALTGFYCGIHSENEPRDVQTLILEVIAGMQLPGSAKSKKRLMDLVKKYIIDPRYTPLCFRIAWQTRYENATHYISQLLECLHKKTFDIHETIEDFLIECGVSKFKELLVPMMKLLRVDNLWKYFLKILFKVGVEVHVPEFPFTSEYLLMRWKVYGQPAVPLQKIPCGKVNYRIMNLIDEFEPPPISEKEKDETFQESVEVLLEEAA